MKLNIKSIGRLRLFIANAISNHMLPKHINFTRKPRPWIYKVLGGLKIGKNVRMYGGTYILSRKVSIDDNAFIGADCLFTSSDKVPISIGRDCGISFGVKFVCGSHEIGPSCKRAGKGTLEPIKVGDGTWIGCRATILGGVTIGKGVVIGSASLVNKDVADNTIVAGVPAKVLRVQED